MDIDLSLLIPAAQSGDQAALEALYTAYAKEAHFLSLKLTKSEAEAEALTAEVFKTAFEGLSALAGPQDFPRRLKQIAVEKSVAMLKNQVSFTPYEKPGADAAAFSGAASENPAIPALLPEELAENEETARHLVEIIDALPLPQRVCVFFYYYEGLTVTDISLRLSVPESTVISHLTEAQETIRKELEKLGNEKGVKLYMASPLVIIPLIRLVAANSHVPASILNNVMSVFSINAAAATAGTTTATAGTTTATAGTATTATATASTAAGISTAGVVAVTAGVVCAGVATAVIIAAPWQSDEPLREREREAGSAAFVIPDDIHTFEGRYYKLFSDSSVTWHEARDFCEEAGGHLVTVTSMREQEFIAGMLADYNGTRIWLGGTDEEEEGVWRWVTGEPWEFEFWAPGEPNNDFGTEHYLGIWWNDHRNVDGPGNWNDFNSRLTASFICEWPDYASLMIYLNSRQGDRGSGDVEDYTEIDMNDYREPFEPAVPSANFSSMDDVLREYTRFMRETADFFIARGVNFDEDSEALAEIYNDGILAMSEYPFNSGDFMAALGLQEYLERFSEIYWDEHQRLVAAR
jgi:RNA polymerase sigma factor (sigma-70 family)